MRICLALATIAALSCFAADSQAADAPSRSQLDFFESKVRPLLNQHCYQCHSAKAQKLKGGLHLDSRDGAIKGGDSGTALIPGDPDKSRIIQAVRYTNPDEGMPPKGKLPDAAIKDLETWVKMGAPWPEEKDTAVATKKGPDYEKLVREFWCYKPIKIAKPQAGGDTSWARGEIDRYLLAGLQSKGLKPVADADRVTLIRRVYFDLIGLPPTPQEIDDFVADKSSDAFEKVVDRLLASSAFGERWGRHWLDVARYAESLTLRGFVLKDAWKYRDYVIDQFNQDRPFSQFMQEQVAGDLMPATSPEQKRRQMTGTTFLTIGNNNLEEQDKKQLRMDVVDEQLETFGKAFLAQTIGCARCHDHKFDPIPTKDYYALAGIFRNAKTLEHANVSKWLEVPLPVNPQDEPELAKHEAAVAAMQRQVAAAKAMVASAKLNKAGKGAILKPSDFPGLVVDDRTAKIVGDWKDSASVKPYIGEGYLTDMGGEKGKCTITFQPEIPEAGRYDIRLAYTASKNRDKAVPVTIFSADGEKTVHVNMQETPPIDGRFVSLGTYAFEKNNQGFVLVSNEGTTGHVVVDACQFLPAEQIVAGDGQPLAASQNAPRQSEPATQPAMTAEQIKQLEAQLKKMQESGPKRETVISVVEEKTIEDSPIHVRGNVHNLGAKVPRGYLSAVPVKNPPKIPSDQSGRLQLGQWLAAADNPLPNRVIANRVWYWLMGAGIVRTVDNFGTTGELPSHPELLDYLANRFAEQNGSVKKLVREIVLSHAYQLASSSDEKDAAIDPENRLCWRANRERLDGDAIRDAMLAISGQLDRAAGGPGFKPGLSSDYTFKHTDTRRSVYVPAFRNAMNEALEAFDAADPSMVTGRRNTSTVAPQALFMLNHPFVQEQAKAAAGRLMKEGPTDAAARTDLAYRWTLGRLPTEAEKNVILKYVNGYSSTAKDAEQESWAQVFHGLFASIDFRYVE
jgi:hypothetical protein